MQLEVEISFSCDIFDVAYLIGGKMVHALPFATI
jgi:hypothetical protein